MTTPSESETAVPPSSARALIAQLIAYAVALCIATPFEIDRLQKAAASEAGLWSWFAGINGDTTLCFLLLVVVPLFWIVRRSPPATRRSPQPGAIATWLAADTRPRGSSRGWSGWRAWTLAAVVGTTSIVVSGSIASIKLSTGERSSIVRFGSLPPAYHDEYSYLFQAQTYLAGRLSFPSHREMPELFDQMHVLNEGRFASRYFPGTGIWIAPFLKLGHPFWGQWLAGALSAVFFFWAGRELGGGGVGLTAGLLTALSPGMGLFSNMLLSHHPTLLGLSLFTFTFLRMLRTCDWRDAVWAGIGLSGAMLCRPLTAAGFALPMGIWFVVWLWKGANGSERFPGSLRRTCWTMFLAMGIPLAAGFVTVGVTNKAITGSVWTTPYQVFTDVYTPRHVFGFNNVLRGEQRIGPRVLDNYDRWAKNLTPALAFENVKNRSIASWQWTLGIIPLCMASIVFFVLVPRTDSRWWLVPASILSLHAVYVPYWYDGIMHWHYVFETGPLWLLMFAGATQALVSCWRRAGRGWMPYWWSCMVGAALVTTYASLEPFWSPSRVKLAVSEIAFSRLKYRSFRNFIDKRLDGQRALVLVEADPADRSIDYVVNHPALNDAVLYGRYRGKETDIDRVVELFPDRRCYIFRVTSGKFIPLEHSSLRKTKRASPR